MISSNQVTRRFSDLASALKTAKALGPVRVPHSTGPMKSRLPIPTPLWRKIA